VKIAVVMPVGPSDEELRRSRDTIASILAWEPGVRWIILIDDGPPGRDLAHTDARTVVLTHPFPRRRMGKEDRVTAATLSGFVWALRHTDADAVMKIDTDALVIAPFADKLAALFSDATVGLGGCYDLTPNGEPRSFRAFERRAKRCGWLVQPRAVSRSRMQRTRRIVRDARAGGYRWGEHAIGAAVAVPRHALDRIAERGDLADIGLFLGTRLYDDPVLALLVRSVGLRPAGDSGDGGIFGISWQGLPDTPERLQARGFSIVHSVKNDPRHTEAEIRDFFAAARPAGV
jgi:hypothetical protein